MNPNNKPLSFLVVEDDAGVIQAIRLTLEALCHSAKLTIVQTLSEARKVLASAQRTDASSFDVAILDGQLPDGNTTDGLLGEVREQFPTMHLMAFSGNPDIFAQQMRVCDSGIQKGQGNLVFGIKSLLEKLEDQRQKNMSRAAEPIAA